MTDNLSLSQALRAAIGRNLARFRKDERGGVAIVMGLMMPVLVGMFGIGVEVSNWYLKTRQLQNAADAAAIAAASNNGSNYATEANAVAAYYNLINGTNNVQTQPAKVNNASDSRCPATYNGQPNPDCYRMTINWTVPLYLAQVVGYAGNTVNNGKNAQLLTRTALAVPEVFKQPICLLGLNTASTAITINGGPNTDFTGCSIMSNSNENCNGTDAKATFGLAAGTSDDCGKTQYSNMPPVTDPYEYMKSNIPTDLATKCSNNYPQVSKVGGVWGGGTAWSGTKSITGTYDNPIKATSGNAGNLICGDLRLTGDVTIDAPAGAVLYIMNGVLDTQGHTFRTANGSEVTLVFTGTNGGGYKHYPTDNAGGGTLDFEATKDGPFPGMAIYQDPALTNGVDFTYTGNDPTWQITGSVYAPHATVTMSGAVNKSSNGSECFVFVADKVIVNGTGSIYAQSPNGDGCKAAGLNMPFVPVPGHARLVY